LFIVNFGLIATYHFYFYSKTLKLTRQIEAYELSERVYHNNYMLVSDHPLAECAVLRSVCYGEQGDSGNAYPENAKLNPGGSGELFLQSSAHQ
jgi:hypothetical protein